jgi:hypothetical protein
MPDIKEMAKSYLMGGHDEPDGDEDGDDPTPASPDDHRHEGDQIMREHLDAVHENNHQAAHDAMAAMIDHHMAKKMLKK